MFDRSSNRRVCAGCLIVVLLAWFNSADAQTVSDEIFNSGAEPGIVLHGTAGYPTPLSGATIELHLGSYVATTQTKADGTYDLFVESRQFASLTIAELFAFGQGANSTQAWASPLGPSDRLQTLAAGGTLAYPVEPFLNLNPYTTATAAALRAYNGFSPIGDKATFYKAARSFQPTVDHLVWALALVARGDQNLPAGAANTFAAVAALAPSQQLYADEQNLSFVDCSSTPTAPFCQVISTLPTDPSIVPAIPLIDGRFYTSVCGFCSGSGTVTGLRPNATTADFFDYDAQPFTANSTALPDGGHRFARTGDVPFSAYYDSPVYGSMQVLRYNELVAVHARSTFGPGGQVRVQGATEYKSTYPNNPEIPQPVYTTSAVGLPVYAGNDPLPAELQALLPDVSSSSFVLVSPFTTSGPNGPYGYDIYNFSTGTTKLQGKSFTFSGASTPALSLNFAADATIADVEFINEESSGIWRVRMHETSASDERLLDGLLMETVNTAGGFTAVNLPGTYLPDINGQICGGPYANLTVLASNTICTPFGWVFDVAGGVKQYGSSTTWGAWQLPGGGDAGRLLFAKPSFVSPSQERGWELVRSDGANDLWVLETAEFSPPAPPPITFQPTNRLSHVQRQ